MFSSWKTLGKMIYVLSSRNPKIFDSKGCSHLFLSPFFSFSGKDKSKDSPKDESAETKIIPLKTESEKFRAKKEQKLPEIRKSISQKTGRKFPNCKLLIQILKKEKYCTENGLPKYVKIGTVSKENNQNLVNTNNDLTTSSMTSLSDTSTTKILFPGKVRTERLFITCARLCRVIYWPDKEKIKNTHIKLMYDQEIGLGDRYFKRKRSNGHQKDSFYLYDEADMDKKELKKEHRSNDLRYSVTVSESGYMFVCYRGTTTIKNWTWLNKSFSLLIKFSRNFLNILKSIPHQSSS